MSSYSKTMRGARALSPIPFTLTLLAAGLFGTPAPAEPVSSAPGAVGATGQEQILPDPNETFLDFLRQAEEAATQTVATSPTVTLADGTTTAAAPTTRTIPAWLSGPTTGTVMGLPLPLGLDDCVNLALKHSFTLQSSERDVKIASSTYRQEVFEFVPFVDIFSGYRFTDSKTGIRTGSGLERTRQHDVNVGVQVQQNLPTGGDLSIRDEVNRTRTWERYRVETVDPITGRVTDVSRDYFVSHEYGNTFDVTARQPLLRGGGLRVGMANLRLARIGQIQSALTDGIRRRDLVLSVIRTYFLILGAQLDAEVSLRAVDVRREFYEYTLDLYRVEHSLAEYQTGSAKIQWLNEQQRLRALQAQFLDSLDALLVLMGLPLETPLRLSEFTGQVPELSDLGLPDQETGVREALANRPELVLADLDMRRARINVDVARNATWPFLDLEASYGDTERGPHFSDVRDIDNRRTWSIGTLFDLPLPNVGNREALRRARLRLEKTEIAQESLERDISEEVRNLYRSLLANRDRIDILGEQKALADRTLEVETGRFREGESTIIQVRQAQDDAVQASTGYNNALLRYLADLASLYRAVGRSLYHELAAEDETRALGVFMPGDVR